MGLDKSKSFMTELGVDVKPQWDQEDRVFVYLETGTGFNGERVRLDNDQNCIVEADTDIDTDSFIQVNI